MIKTAPKIQRMKSVRDIEDELDKITSLIVRARTSYCVLCASILKLECGHFFPRFLRPVRWHFDNLATLCQRCNYDHESNPEPYRVWLIERLGRAGFNALDRLAHKNTKAGYSELVALLEGRKALYAEVRIAA